MYNIAGLQKLCDILLENPSWTIAHLIANFNLTEYISHPKVLDLIDEADYATMMTPIQVSTTICPNGSISIDESNSFLSVCLLLAKRIQLTVQIWINLSDELLVELFINVYFLFRFLRILFCLFVFLSNEQLQLAIKLGHHEMVKKLIPQCKLNHLDVNMNSLFHYAAPTTKEIINVSTTIEKLMILTHTHWTIRSIPITNTFKLIVI